MTTSEEEIEAFLAHYGVPGMKWGVRKDRVSTPGVPRKTDKDAAKDAAEFARAKMYYGEGAGTRRKLIKATVEAKSKKDPNYKKAFENHLENQDLSTHAAKARKERKRTDTVDKGKKSVSYLARRATNEMGTQAALTALVISGVAFMRSPQAKRMMNTSMSVATKNAKNVQRTVTAFAKSKSSNKAMVTDISNFLRENGL